MLPLRISVRLGLRSGLWLGLGFISYVYFVSTKPIALLPCITVRSEVAYE